MDCYVSVKAPSLGFSIDMFGDLVERARQGDVGVHFDSLGPETADQTFSLIGKLLARHDKIGCTLLCGWRRSLTDSDRVVEMGLRVRVVKGQWADPENPVSDLREGYLNVIGRFAGGALHVFVATHDAWLAHEALKRLIDAGTTCELELLYGLPIRHALPVANIFQVPVRVYVPYGYSWLPYVIGNMRKNPHIALWVLKDLFMGGSSRLWSLKGDST